MAYRTRRALMSAEDYALLPDSGDPQELVLGWVVSEPRPGGEHARTLVRIGAILLAHCDRTGVGVVLGDGGFVLSRNPDTVRAPDVSFISMARFNAAGRPEGFFPGAPDLAVEILSPSNRPGEIRLKVADYFAAGSRLAWVVDPGERTITVYASLLSARTLGEEDTLTGGDLLPGLSVPVARLFGLPEEDATW